MWQLTHSTREWGEFFDEGVRVTVARETVDEDPWEVYDADPESDRFESDFATPADVGFRTAVSTQTGLRESVTDSLSVLDVELAHGLSRG